MSSQGKIVPFPADGAATAVDTFAAARCRLDEILVRYCLIESYERFLRHGIDYPFLGPHNLLPNSDIAKVEQPYQNTALVFLLESALPRSLNKHFRLRGSNRVTWKNIRRLAPDIDLDAYKSAHCRLDAPEAEHLVRQLSRLDYALMLERDEEEDPRPAWRLTHMHVKVERLTDNAIKDLTKSLGYVDRRLFERGEDYVDALEIKFFEYFGFSSNAAGRKSAAAIAAQLLGTTSDRFAVFVSSQEDCRLTRLDDSDLVTQYLLIRLDDDDESRLRETARQHDAVADDYIFLRDPEGGAVVLYRVRFRRTAPALGINGGRIDRSLTEPWLATADQAVLPPPGGNSMVLPFDWARSES